MVDGPEFEDDGVLMAVTVTADAAVAAAGVVIGVSDAPILGSCWGMKEV